MLSTDRAYSIRYPVRNSSPEVLPMKRNTTSENVSDRATQSALHAAASLSDTCRGRRWKTSRSTAMSVSTTALKPTHHHMFIGLFTMQERDSTDGCRARHARPATPRSTAARDDM